MVYKYLHGGVKTGYVSKRYDIVLIEVIDLMKFFILCEAGSQTRMILVYSGLILGIH